MSVESQPPIRPKRPVPSPGPHSKFERTCLGCGASFLALAPGRTGERGLWGNGYKWWCSQECWDAFRGEGKETQP